MLLLTVITLACCTSVGLSGSCYYCQNFEFENEVYDPNCSDNQYSGNTITCEEEAQCFTDVYEDGRLHRGCETRHTTGQCVHHNYPHQTQCFCDGDLCNIDLCDGCIDGPDTNPTTIKITETTSITPDRTTTSLPTKPPMTTASIGTHEGTTPTIPPVTTTETPQTETATMTSHRTTSVSPTKPPVTTASIGTHEGTTPTLPTRPPVSTTEAPQTITTDVTTPSASQIPTETPEVTTPTPEGSSNTPQISTLVPDVSTQTPDITTTEEISTPTITPTTAMVETTTQIKIVNITCYDCQNSHPDWEAFDETCIEPGYNGNTYACENCGSCFTEIHDDGSVIRGEAGDFTEECAYGEDYVACYCIKDLCNTELCEQCEGREK